MRVMSLKVYDFKVDGSLIIFCILLGPITSPFTWRYCTNHLSTHHRYPFLYMLTREARKSMILSLYRALVASHPCSSRLCHDYVCRCVSSRVASLYEIKCVSRACKLGGRDSIFMKMSNSQLQITRTISSAFPKTSPLFSNPFAISHIVIVA